MFFSAPSSMTCDQIVRCTINSTGSLIWSNPPEYKQAQIMTKNLAHNYRLPNKTWLNIQRRFRSEVSLRMFLEKITILKVY